MVAHYWQRTKFQAYRRQKKCWYVKQLAKTCELFSLYLFSLFSPLSPSSWLGNMHIIKSVLQSLIIGICQYFHLRKPLLITKEAKWYKSAEMLITAHSCSLWASEKVQNILGAQEPNKTFTASTCTPHTVYISGWEYTEPAYQKWIKFPPNMYREYGQNLPNIAKYYTWKQHFSIVII